MMRPSRLVVGTGNLAPLALRGSNTCRSGFVRPFVVVSPYKAQVPDCVLFGECPHGIYNKYDMGRKRKHPRIEDLIRISVHRRIVNKDTRSIRDRDGNRFDFVDETGGQTEKQFLVVYVNESRT